MPDIWFTSDTHFGHKGIMRHQVRPGDTLDEMDQVLCDTLNKYVLAKDVLYHLGDFCWKASRAGHYRQRLNVKELHVTYGNHDASSLHKHVSTAGLMLFKRFGEIKFHLMHYPALSWNVKARGGCHLYGHTHGIFEEEWDNLWPWRRATDVGVDNAFRLHGEHRPFNLDEIVERIGSRMPPD